MTSKMFSFFPILAGCLLSACSSGSSETVTFDEIADEATRLETILDMSSPTPISALGSLGNATYEGVARVIETEESGSALDAATRSYVAGAQVTVDVDFIGGNISGSASNFFELDDPNSDLSTASTEPISGSFTVTDTGVTGTITKSDGEVASYDLTGSFGFFGSNAEILAGSATGTSSAAGRDDLNAGGELVAERQ